jgi:hypothetical protein
MRGLRLLFAIGVAGFLAVGMSAAADPEKVPLYTSDDLDRMFGPAPRTPTDPVDKTRPEDWGWVEQFLDRQYSRIDADRRYDLDRGVLDIAAARTRPISPYYGGSVAWSLGYPAYTWWSTVHAQYSAHTNLGFGSSHGHDFSMSDHSGMSAHDRGAGHFGHHK